MKIEHTGHLLSAAIELPTGGAAQSHVGTGGGGLTSAVFYLVLYSEGDMPSFFLNKRLRC